MMSWLRRAVGFALGLVLALNVVAPAAAVPCKERWVFSFTLEFKSGDWSLGPHAYDIRSTADSETENSHRDFTVDAATPLVPGHVRLGPFGLQDSRGFVNAINPAEDTVMQITWAFERATTTHQEMVAIADASFALFRWDGGPWVTPERSPVTSSCALEGDGKWFRNFGSNNKLANEATIVSSLPLTGPNGADTQPIVNAVRLALDDAGWRAGSTHLSYVVLDSGGAGINFDLGKEIANANLAAADASALAFIGTFNSGSARSVIPILCQAGVAMVSPSNTYNGLTKAADYNRFPGEPGVYYQGCAHNYARVAIRDPLEGAMAAKLTSTLGGSRAYLVYTPDSFPVGMVTTFSAAAPSLGLTIGGSEAVTGPPSADLVQRVVNSGSDFVYLAGIDADMGAVARAVHQAAPGIRFVGNDGIEGSPVFVQQAGAAAEGTFALVNVWWPQTYTGPAAFWLARYQALHGPLASPYALYGFEAANVVLAALRRAGRDPDRAAVREAVLATRDFRGLLGTWSFDADGDTTATRISYAQVIDGNWHFVGSLTLP